MTFLAILSFVVGGFVLLLVLFDCSSSTENSSFQLILGMNGQIRFHWRRGNLPLAVLGIVSGGATSRIVLETFDVTSTYTLSPEISCSTASGDGREVRLSTKS